MFIYKGLCVQYDAWGKTVKQPRSCCKLYKFLLFWLVVLERVFSFNILFRNDFDLAKFRIKTCFSHSEVSWIRPVCSRIMFYLLISLLLFRTTVLFGGISYYGIGKEPDALKSQLTLDITYCLYIELIHLISLALASVWVWTVLTSLLDKSTWKTN